MSYSTFLESQNKNILNSLHEWQEKALQYGIVIEAKDKRIAELEDILNHIKRHNDHLAIQNEDLEARNKILIETGHWIGQDEAHDLKIAVEKFLLYTRLGRIGVGNKQFWDTPDWQIQDLSKALNNCKIKK